jgi:small nuclear ribonucleoprotein D1
MPAQLVKFLQQLTESTVEVELKNGTIVTGQVVHVDQNMNTHLSNVKVVSKGKKPVAMDQLSVRGATIRYVVLPSELNYDHMLSKCTDTNASKKPRKEAPASAPAA